MNTGDTVFTVATHEGSYDLTACVRLIGKDMLIAVWGGDTPHIGAVAMAYSQQSIVNPEKKNATVSTFSFPGHMEDHLVKPIAEKVALFAKRNVVVTAGTHWDKINKNGIRNVIENGGILSDLIIGHLVKSKHNPLEK